MNLNIESLIHTSVIHKIPKILVSSYWFLQIRLCYSQTILQKLVLLYFIYCQQHNIW